MRVLGIDPGTATTGYGVVEESGEGLRALAYGVVTTGCRPSTGNSAAWCGSGSRTRRRWRNSIST
jgi:hypothetical protein